MFAEGEWYLMDLEWANRIDSDMEGYKPNPHYLPPELARKEGGRQWTEACDMWQFGKLVEHWNQLDDNGCSYVYTQSQDAPERRMNASNSLLHDPHLTHGPLYLFSDSDLVPVGKVLFLFPPARTHKNFQAWLHQD